MWVLLSIFVVQTRRVAVICELMKEVYSMLCALSDCALEDVRAVVARESGEAVASELKPLELDGTMSPEALIADVVRQYYAHQASWLLSAK